MGVWAWLILLAISAALASAGQYAFFRNDRGPKDFDWVYMAGGSLLFGFTAHVWYPGFGLVLDGLNLVPAVLGSVIGAVVLEMFYRLVIRRRRLA